MTGLLKQQERGVCIGDVPGGGNVPLRGAQARTGLKWAVLCGFREFGVAGGNTPVQEVRRAS